MIEAFALLLLCQLAGEIFARGLTLPLPGPVAGMGLLFAFLCWRGRMSPKKGETSAIPATLTKVSDALFRHLSLLFIPAAVGIVAHFNLIKANALAILAALTISTVLTFTVTALVFRNMMRIVQKKRP